MLAGSWGLFGAFAVEGMDLYDAVRRHRRWPWHDAGGSSAEATAVQYAIAELIRLMIGWGLAIASVGTGQVSGPLGAIAVGAAAPVIISRWAKGVIPLVADKPDANSVAKVPAIEVETSPPMPAHRSAESGS
jgi:hypothetical protein